MKVKHHTFSNGFRIIYEPSHSQTALTSIYVFCDLGSVYESEKLHGVSHFIEHMCFKGTKKIPHAKDIFMNYDKIGAYFNAFTEKRYTCYTINCNDEYVQNCVNVVSDMLLNSTFRKEEFSKEYNVVVEENVKDENDMEDTLSTISDKLVFHGSDYARPVDSIEYHKKNTLHHDVVNSVYKQYYIPSRMVISVVSNIPFSKFKQIIRNSDFTMKIQAKPFVFPIIRHSVLLQQNNEPQIALHSKKGNSTILLSISFRTCSHLSPDRYKLNILKQIVGGYMSSRLSMILREQHGLTYSSSVNTTNYEEIGCFSIQSETDSKNILKHGKTGKGVLPITLTIIKELITSGVTQTEVDVAKGYINGNLTRKMEEMDNITLHNGEHMLIYGNLDEFTQYNQIFDKFYVNITKAEVNTIIRKYFLPEFMTICLVGDHLPTLHDVKQCIHP